MIARYGIDRKHLVCFVSLVEQGSFVAAAQHLGISQSSIARSMRSFEEHVGGRVFERLGRRYVLTPLGRVLIGPTRAGLASLDRVSASAFGVHELAIGHLVVCTLPTLSRVPTAAVVGEILRSSPGVRFSIVAPSRSLTSAVIERVQSGEADLGVLETPPAPIPGLSQVDIGGDEMDLILPSAYLNLQGTSVPVAALKEIGLVVGPYWESSSVYRRLIASDPHLDEYISVRTDHRHSFTGLAMSGGGAVLASRTQANAAREKGAVVASLTPSVPRELSVVFRRDVMGALVRRFIAVAEGFFT